MEKFVCLVGLFRWGTCKPLSLYPDTRGKPTRSAGFAMIGKTSCEQVLHENHMLADDK